MTSLLIRISSSSLKVKIKSFHHDWRLVRPKRRNPLVGKEQGWWGINMLKNPLPWLQSLGKASLADAFGTVCSSDKLSCLNFLWTCVCRNVFPSLLAWISDLWKQIAETHHLLPGWGSCDWFSLQAGWVMIVHVRVHVFYTRRWNRFNLSPKIPLAYS